ncbi:unnamed protein product [Gongylonema pulchrum]|uniref:Ig-like domain-containing protein n=1 Tax=Gongylonema pulchrum TaxID=637853 RepID=A0A183DJQ8_9BILA|nr:unnamed protein product [Gongylonema pulchrum]
MSLMHRIDVVIANDEGDYRCSVKRSQHITHRTIRLTVKEPAIKLYATDVSFPYHFLTSDSVQLAATVPKN